MDATSTIATGTLVAVGAAVATVYPEWWTTKDGLEILAVLVLGTVTTLAREAYYAYDTNECHPTSFPQVLSMIPVGLTGAIMGQEIAELSGFPQADWLFVISIAWIGGEALDRLSLAIMGIVDKALGAIGVRAESAARFQQDKDELRHKREIQQLQEALDQNL